MSAAEDKVINEMREIATKQPAVKHPTTEFIRDWAYGNAGLEDERITREQVANVIPDKL